MALKMSEETTGDERASNECLHIKQVRVADNKSFLNPRAWACQECGTTNTVLACLLCSHVGCDECDEGHAQRHFDHTHHPIVIEVNQKRVHCFACDKDVAGDDVLGVISTVKGLLEDIKCQVSKESRTRSGRIMRQPSLILHKLKLNDVECDQLATAKSYRKTHLLGKCFSGWVKVVAMAKDGQETVDGDHAPSLFPAPPPPKRQKVMPGIIGLRNLGNTCYMNAVLQALSHIAPLRECLRSFGSTANKLQGFTQSNAEQRRSMFSRQTTVECFQRINQKPVKRGSLNKRNDKDENSEYSERSLCQELHSLFRVMWSGKWTVVTPHTLLNAVWELVPSFHGYNQQDAQEFLSEILDHLQAELESYPPLPVRLNEGQVSVLPAQLIGTLFEGRLCSSVTCERCAHESYREEPFCDLSLDFPVEFHMRSLFSKRLSLQGKSLSIGLCHLLDLLKHFIAFESIPCYSCDSCSAMVGENGRGLPSASKRMMVAKLPEVLRIHLKRFKWTGSSYSKIDQHVTFPFELSMRQFTKQMASPGCHGNNEYLYDLSSIIIHHGKGFSSGHYTSYCWNQEAESWIFCNDSRIAMATPQEVELCQPYILIYVRRHGCAGLERPPSNSATPILPSPLQKYSLSFKHKQ